MKHLFLALFLWLPQAVRAAEPLQPLQIAEQFVAPAGWPLMRGYLCCETAGQARDQTLGQQLPPRVQRNCQLVQQGAATAVVAVELRDSVGRRDFYLHFRKEADAWKLGAVRNLAMTHLGPPMLGILTAMPPAEVALYNQRHPAASHAFTVGNLRLWTGPDADIATHFGRHRAAFAEAARLARAGSTPTLAADTSRTTNPALAALLRRLFVTRVGGHDTGTATGLEFLIGGMTGNTVGLLFEPNPAALPAMSPDRLIVLRALGKGWYLYKTT